jgi:hypothetical protein
MSPQGFALLHPGLFSRSPFSEKCPGYPRRGVQAILASFFREGLSASAPSAPPRPRSASWPPVCSPGGCVLTLFSMPLHVRSGSVSVRISGGREQFPRG